jgi:hypothetical protein
MKKGELAMKKRSECRVPFAIRCDRSLITSALIVLAVAGVGSGQTCPTNWTGMPTSTPDADIAVGRVHVLVADHDHYRLFDKCGSNLGFVTPFGPTLLPNGIPHNGVEVHSSVPYHGFYWSTGPYAQQNGINILADERVIHDPLTNRFIAMATGRADRGVFIGVSAVHDATSWPCVTEIAKVVPCPSIANAGLHRGSISRPRTPWTLPTTSSGSSGRCKASRHHAALNSRDGWSGSSALAR